MRQTLFRLTLVFVLVSVMAAGCAQMPRQTMPAKPYSIQELIDQTEQNAQNSARFRSKGGRMSVKISTDKGLKRYDLDAVLVLYEQPKHLYLTGSFLGHPALQIGSNAQNYWLGVMPEPSQLHWGYWKFVDSERNSWRMGGPIKLMEALGQINLRQPEGNLSTPTLERRKNDNILKYTAKDPKRGSYLAKEVFITPYATPTISQIVYYNPDGSVELTTTYSNYLPMGNGQMANKVELVWPADKSYMRLTLGKVAAVESLPAEAFKMPDASAFAEVVQVDEKCQ
ncbi:MAG: hypothetical protein WC975_14770 [Phycisphaerae bacterium]